MNHNLPDWFELGPVMLIVLLLMVLLVIIMFIWYDIFLTISFSLSFKGSESMLSSLGLSVLNL